jgi:hypothetical protein
MATVYVYNMIMFAKKSKQTAWRELGSLVKMATYVKHDCTLSIFVDVHLRFMFNTGKYENNRSCFQA